MTLTIERVGYGPPALAALRRVVAEVKAADPMTALTVIAPNTIAGTVARRRLAEGFGGHTGVAGLEVTTLRRLAERVASAALAPRRPATSAVLAAAWRAELAVDAGRFTEIATHQATVRALVRAHRELRELDDAALSAVAASGPVTADVVGLHRRVVARLRGDWYDTCDLLRTAARGLEAARLDQVVLYLPQELRGAELEFAGQLAASAQLTVVAARTGVGRADAAVNATVDALASPTTADDNLRMTIPTADRVLTASDSDDEIRAVVREVVATLRHTPAHRVAVLYSAAVPYARLLHEQLGAAGITVNGPGVRAADERAVGRTLLDVLALADSDVARGDLFRVLAAAPVHDLAGARVPVSRWERLSRSAGVVSGDDWTARLDAFITDREAEAVDERAAAEPRDWRVARLEQDAAEALALRGFVARLRDELGRAADLRTWRELSAWCAGLFAGLLGDEAALDRLPPEEQYAAAAVTSTLRTLDGLDGLDTAPDPRALRDVLATELAAALPRVGQFGDGVLVAPMSAAIGLDADAVFAVGLSEDLFPGRASADALLPDRARSAAGGVLPTQRERLNAQYRHLLAAFAVAGATGDPEARGTAVASFPRGDLRRSSHRLPSRYLLTSLRELSDNHALPATTWDRGEYGDALITSSSFAAALLGTDTPATDQEWSTRAAAAGTLDNEVVHAAMAMIHDRAGHAFTRFDGNLTGAEELPDFADGARLVSPTMLESYAECPHSFFVRRLLGVTPVEVPEDIVKIEPLEIGNLMHGAVERLVEEFANQLPADGAAWTAAQHARMVEIGVELADHFRDRGLTGHPRLWEGERDRIVNDLQALLVDDDAWRRDRRASVLASELAFGLRGADPVEIEIPEGRVRMRGSADKVDIGADGTLYVTDLKTGGSTRYDAIMGPDKLAAGTRLQLPVYAYAARARFGEPTTPVSAAYWFVRAQGRRIVVELTADLEARYADTLSVLVRSIRGGLFPLKAPEQPDFAWVLCPYCNPDGLGHEDERRRWERKRHDPVLRELVDLVDPAVAP